MSVSERFMQLGGVSIALECADQRVTDCLALQFGDFLHDAPQAPVQLKVVFHHGRYLPKLPEGDPIYVDERVDAYGRTHCILEAYADGDATLLFFLDGGIVRLPSDEEAGVRTATVWIVDNIFVSGRFEDVVLVTLQPQLRRFGVYTIHAAGAVKDGQALLFVGGSGSGKTTTCLNLVLNGWQMLSNDVVILRDGPDGVYAWPVPDTITLRPKTATLLPQIESYPIGEQSVPNIVLPTDSLPAHRLVNGNWAAPTRVKAICFPSITGEPTTTVSAYMQAIALAVLMQESADRWDADALEAHSDMLYRACQQADCVQVHLGHDMAQQREVLAQLLAAPTPTA